MYFNRPYAEPQGVSELLIESPFRERIKHLAHTLAEQRNPLGRKHTFPNGL